MRIVVPVVALIVGVGVGYWMPRPSGPANQEIAAVEDVREITASQFDVVDVVDGDTFKVIYDGDVTKVRILRIDTPERGDPKYHQATEALRQLIGGKRVELALNDPKGKRDNWGRLLADVRVDGQDVGQAMIATGLAKPWQGR